MRDLGDSDGSYVADALGRTMLLPTDMEELKNMRMQEAIQATYRMKDEVKGQSKAAEDEHTKRIDAAQTLKASEADLAKARENLKEATRERDTDVEELKNMRMQEAIQATYRMEDEVKGQSKAAEDERTKHIDAARTLKASEADLVKARENLKETTQERDSALAGLTGAQKQAEEQTKRLLDVEEQLQIANEQISDLKKKLIMVENAKGVAEFARDEAVRAK
ncbi:uncharacterized protein LOC126728300 [Quercus robur]|uniref:uncharacterized protein LOC126728300 n=1 Tax=Quercus robur TaxID=38942 RepID=UPI0021617705|nr:uncharacterized protein LOC126728300 [Quercus robur]